MLIDCNHPRFAELLTAAENEVANGCKTRTAAEDMRGYFQNHYGEEDGNIITDLMIDFLP